MKVKYLIEDLPLRVKSEALCINITPNPYLPVNVETYD